MFESNTYIHILDIASLAFIFLLPLALMKSKSYVTDKEIEFIEKQHPISSMKDPENMEEDELYCNDVGSDNNGVDVKENISLLVRA